MRGSKCDPHESIDDLFVSGPEHRRLDFGHARKELAPGVASETAPPHRPSRAIRIAPRRRYRRDNPAPSQRAMHNVVYVAMSETHHLASGLGADAGHGVELGGVVEGGPDLGGRGGGERGGGAEEGEGGDGLHFF